MSIRKLIASALTAGVMLSLLPSAVMADTAGWVGSDTEGWHYLTTSGEYVTSAWQEDGGNWYYFDDEGLALINKWAFIDGKLYHFGSSGAMDKNKWIECGDFFVGRQLQEWIEYFPDYKKYMDEYLDKKVWRYVGSNGAAYTGWKQIGGTWYHFNEDIGYDYYNRLDVNESHQNAYAAMTYGLFLDKDHSLYLFDGNGHYKKNGWCQYYDDPLSPNWYYFGSDGRAYNGWKQINGKWYLFADDDYGSCYMVTGYFEDYSNGFKPYYFDENGAMVTGWYEVTTDYGEEGVYKKWIYANSDGVLVFNDWLNYGGKWYYFRYDTMIADVKDFVINGKKYDFDKNGVCLNYDGDKAITGWHLLREEDEDEKTDRWYYIGSDGERYKNKWLSYKGAWYYFDRFGWLVTDLEFYAINGKHYRFDESGKCTTPNGVVTTSGWYCFKYFSEDFWFYYGSDMKFVTGWQQIKGKWYFFTEDGQMYTGDMYDGNDREYYFKDSGEMVTGWFKIYDEWAYADKSGLVYNNKWLNYNGSWYYFDTPNMVSDRTDFMINGKLYDFDENGKCLNPDSGRIIVTD